MEYKIYAHEDYIKDMDAVFSYLIHKFKANLAVRKLKNKVNKAMLDLATAPEAYRRLKSVDNSLIIYRLYDCDNFVIVYSVNDNIVRLHRFLYVKSDIKNRLKEK